MQRYIGHILNMFMVKLNIVIALSVRLFISSHKSHLKSFKYLSILHGLISHEHSNNHFCLSSYRKSSMVLILHGLLSHEHSNNLNF